MNTLTYQIGSVEVVDRRAEFDGSYKRRELSDIEFLAIHHVGAGDYDSTAESIARYHTENLGWPGIGYHFLVHWDGQIEYVGDILTMRYNIGSLNKQVVSINVCGNWMERRPEQVQLDATRALCANLQFALGWFVPIRGHRELPKQATSCPGDTAMGVDGWLEYIRAGLEG